MVRKGLEALGYNVKKPKELANPIFYQAVTLGDVDYWSNGWLPMHRAQMPKNLPNTPRRSAISSKAGGLQGYLVTSGMWKNTTSNP